MKRKNIKVFLIIGIVLALVAGIGATYSFFIYRKDGGNISLETGEININFANNKNYLTVPDAYPVSDMIGKIYPYYADFTITGTTEIAAIKYEIQIVPDDSNTIDSKYIKVYLTDQDDNVIVEPTIYDNLASVSDKIGKVVYSSSFPSSSSSVSKSFRLRVWIDESYTKNVQETFNFNIYLHATNTTD